MGGMPPLHTPESFWRSVAKSNGCWIWTGHTDRGGYGALRYQGRMVKAHILAYELIVGLVPEGLELDHLCRVRTCVNPAHLEPVTHQENVRRAFALKTSCRNGHPYADANNLVINAAGARLCRLCRNSFDAARRRRVRRDRGLQTPRGEQHHNAKLTEAHVRAIRAASGTLDEVAARFGVSRSNVGLIRQRKSWGWLT
jgi:hypothetical protein